MAAIIMPPAASFNVKSDQNIGCWLCEHFQRYEGGEAPIDCAGECRKESPWAGNFTKELESPTDWPRDGYFTYIPFGNVAWCNGFQNSLEQNIPPSPGDASGDCLNTDPITWTVPQNVRNDRMFNKKITEDSCWFCDNFQRLYVDPSGQQAAEACKGYCQHRPQPDYHTEEGFIPDGMPSPFITEVFPLFTKITFSALTWCSKWERATHEVPPVPTGPGQIVCEEPAV